jgi:hypothetical protein
MATEVLLEPSLHPTEVRGRRRGGALLGRLVKSNGMQAELRTTHIQIHRSLQKTFSLCFVKGKSS